MFVIDIYLLGVLALLCTEVSLKNQAGVELINLHRKIFISLTWPLTVPVGLIILFRAKQ